MQEKENPLFDRKEIIIEVESDVSPSLREALRAVAEKFQTDEENVKIKKIDARFGSRNFIISANVYKSREEKESLERKSKKETELEKVLVEEKARKEAPAEEKPQNEGQDKRETENKEES